MSLKPRSRTVSIFGLGYVGCVSVACLAHAGHRVIGVDVHDSKVSLVNQGKATIVEPGLDELMAQVHMHGRVSATSDLGTAVKESEIIIITVGTPSRPDGELDLGHIFAVAEDIGRTLRELEGYRTIAIRSTIKPGTCQRVDEIIEESSGKTRGEHYSVVANPEFLREGSAIKDYLNPPYVLIGAEEARGADEIASIYSNIKADIIRVRPGTAEMIKYINNSWHALKVAFGNEVGSVCKQLSIDSQEVIDVFLEDRILNISPSYLRPGFAFGGACLPKDLSALVTLARTSGVTTPLLNSIKESNDCHIDRAISLIRAQGRKRIGFFGLSFKADTDDVRNSPALRIIDALLDGGHDIRVFDEAVAFALSSGRSLPSYRYDLGRAANLLVSTPEELIRYAEIVVVAKKDKSLRQVLSTLDGRPLVDLVGVGEHLISRAGYLGLAW